MSVNLKSFETFIFEAVRHFWEARHEASINQRARGVADQGNRSSVTAGKNLDGFIQMTRRLIEENGISNLEVHTNGRANLCIPGFYRPTKNWDLLVVSRNQLIAAIEFKSQVGPSFGNNFNNRVEEAIGNAVDLHAAFREGAFGESQKPFIGYFFVLEDCDRSQNPVNYSSPHFPAFPEFVGASYAKRYEIFCRKLAHEGLYDSAALLLTKKTSIETGNYSEMSKITSPKRFASVLAGKVASIATEL